MLRGKITAERPAGTIKAERVTGAISALRLLGVILSTVASAVLRLIAVASAGTSAVAAALVRLRRLVAGTAGTSSTAASVKRHRLVVALSAGKATTAQAIRRFRRFLASSAGAATLSAAVRRIRRLLAATAGTSSTAATPKRHRKVAPTAAGTSTLANILRRFRRIFPTSAGRTTVSNTPRRFRRFYPTTAGAATPTLTPDKREALLIDSGAVLGPDNEPLLYVAGALPLLNVLGVAATLALSVRLVLSSYSGPCLTVRRSSDNATQNIGFSAGYLDTASLLSFVGAGSGYVTTWYDQSGNANHATQATTSLQPLIVSAGTLQVENTKPNVNFGPCYGDAAHPQMALTTRVTNVRTAGWVTWGGGFFLGDTNAAGTYDFHRDSPFTTDNAPLFDNTRASANVYTGSVQIDGVAKTYNSVPPTSLFSMQLVTAGNANAGLIGGADRIYRSGGQHMGELLLFSGALTSGQLSTIQVSQKAFFGTA